MKTRKNQKLTFHTRKVCCILLIPCMLLSSCQKSADNSSQNLTQGFKNPATTLQATQSPAPTLTTTPEPTPTTTPEPTPTTTPTPTLEPTLAPDFTFLPQPDEPDKTSLLDYMSQEEIDTAFSLSYDPDSPMQLYARYQGQLYNPRCYYCIDLICVNGSMGSMLINIKTFTGPYRFVKYGDSILLQNIYYYVEPFVDPESSEELLQIVDLNNDGYDEFIFDFGIYGKNLYSLAFVYDKENSGYTLLGDFSCATYIPEKQMIYEQINSSSLTPSHQNKYILSGAKAVLSESISIFDDVFTYQKLVDDEFVTILKDVTYDEINKLIDFDTWWNTPLPLQ